MGNMKTATMTLLTLLDYNNNRKIASNYVLDNKIIKSEQLKDVDDLLLYLFDNNNVTISLDELSSWFSCYVSPKDESLYMAELAKQTRKLKQKIYYTAQYFEQVQRSIRVLTHKIYHVCKNHKIEGNYYPCYDDDCYELHYIGLQEMRSINDNLFPLSDMVYFQMPIEIFNIYDTHEVITSSGLDNYIEQLRIDKNKGEILFNNNSELAEQIKILS
jgi:hypothetical protein